jgi:hypothetical protein
MDNQNQPVNPSASDEGPVVPQPGQDIQPQNVTQPTPPSQPQPAPSAYGASSYQQSPDPVQQQPAPVAQTQAEQPAPVVSTSQPSAQSNHYLINQELKMGRESFAVVDDAQNLVCEAKLKMFQIKEHIDVYHDEAAAQPAFTISQEKAMAISKVYDVVSSDGQKMGGFKLEAMQSMMKEHWDILDANGNVIGAINQDPTTSMMGKMGGMMGAGGAAMGTVIPQKFMATMNNQTVCSYQEEMNIGIFFKMDIDFSADTNNMFDRTLGIAAAILLATKHMSTN